MDGQLPAFQEVPSGAPLKFDVLDQAVCNILRLTLHQFYQLSQAARDRLHWEMSKAEYRSQEATYSELQYWYDYFLGNVTHRTRRP
jgi:hypothetical protein